MLNKAEQRAKELYTKSISKGIKAAFTSDAATDYAGEDYENVLLNVVKALDFLALGNKAGALVEARKINEKLKLYNTQVQAQERLQPGRLRPLADGPALRDGGLLRRRAHRLRPRAWRSTRATSPPNYGMRRRRAIWARTSCGPRCLSNAPRRPSSTRSKFGQDKGATGRAAQDPRRDRAGAPQRRGPLQERLRRHLLVSDPHQLGLRRRAGRQVHEEDHASRSPPRAPW